MQSGPAATWSRISGEASAKLMELSALVRHRLEPLRLLTLTDKQVSKCGVDVPVSRLLTALSPF